MGLDMRLYRTQEARPEDKEVLRMERKGKVSTIRPEFPTFIREEYGRWLKANQIHGWFVDNAQRGDDDCREHSVGRYQLVELYQTVLEVINSIELVSGKVVAGRTWGDGKWIENFKPALVIENPEVAMRLLPVRNRVQYERCYYDSAYFEALVRTKFLVGEALDLPPWYGFSYRASW